MGAGAQRLAGYCRISVDEQIGGDNTSIENQKAIITEFINKKFPDSSLEFFEDRDRSGYTFEQREGYRQLRRKLAGHEYDILIVKDFSRFSRRNSKGLAELEDLRDLGIRIISITDNVDFPTNDDWLSIQFRFLMNELPVTDTSKKVKSVINSRQSKGEWICAVPYGYYLHPAKKNTICVDEEGAEVVKQIFDLYNRGWGYKKIANFLTEKGVSTGLQLIAKQMREREADATKVEQKASVIWSHISVAKIVTNDFYIGTLRQHVWTRKGINKSDKRVPVEDNIVFENHHEAIIDKGTFQKAQEQYARRSVSNYKGERKYHHAYSGVLFCDDCGAPMFATTASSRPAGYTCSSYHKRGLKGCTSHHIHESVLNDAVKAYISTVRESLKDRLATLDMEKSKALADKSRSEVHKLEQSITELKEQLKQSSKQRLQQIIRNPDSEEIINESFNEIEKDYLTEIRASEQRIIWLSEDAEKKMELKSNIGGVLSKFEMLLSKEQFSKEDILLIVDRITITEDKALTVMLKADITELLTSFQDS